MSQSKMKPGTENGWHAAWEENVYSQARHMNRYPYDVVVSYIYTKFGHVEDRSKVNILELGCGAGNNLWFAAREGFSVAGIDGSSSALEYARARFEVEGLHGDLRVGDFTTLPWSNESFDFVLDRGALTHNRRSVIQNALKETARVLKTEGRFFSTTLFSWEHPERVYGRDLGDNTFDNFTEGYFRDLGITHFATLEEIEMLFGSHFYITSIRHILEDERLNYTTKTIEAYWQIESIKLPYA